MKPAAHDPGRAGALAALPEGAPVVVLVGRANAGKSTLFNRIARGRRAIVSPIAGTTRDLNVGQAEHRGRNFFVVDSGGLELGGRERLGERVAEGALSAVALADLVVFMLDGRAGLGPGDREAIALIRETGRPMVAAINKMDRAGMEAIAGEYHALGVSPMVLVSAAHGRGVEELLDEIVDRLPAADSAPSPSPDLRLALIGRPNVGKSSLLNRLAGFERAIVDDTPGTTRDPVDVRLRAADRDVLLIDTAGIRRPAKVEGELEHFSVGRAIETIRRAEVLVLVIDSTEGVTDQDARLARLVESEGRALVLVCNKWDLAAKEGRRVLGVRARRAGAGAVSGVCRDALHLGTDGRRRRQDHPGRDQGRRFVARDFPDRASEPDFGRGHRRDGSADGRAAAAQADVRHPGRPFAAAAGVFRQRRTRHPGALPAVPRHAVSRGARARRYAPAAELSPHRPHLGRSARDRRGAAEAVAEKGPDEGAGKGPEESTEESADRKRK